MTISEPKWRKIPFLHKNEMRSNETQYIYENMYSGADKSLARPGRKQATATEDLYVHISYL